MPLLAVAGSTFTFTAFLEDQANAGEWLAAPTIAAGDFQRSINTAGAWTNLDNLPTVAPAGGRAVEIVLSAAETTSAGAGGRIKVFGHDAAGDEWYDVGFEVRVVAADAALTNTAMTLANDSITAAVIAADAIGASELAADAVTEIGTGVWASTTRTLTQTGVSVAAAVAGGVITIKRGDSLSASITDLGNITTRTKLWFTVKDNLADTDAQSIIQIEETAGLVYLNAAAGTAGLGDITVDDATAGDITITLDETATDDLSIASGLYYDVQWYDGTSIATLTEGPCNVTGDVTRAVA